MRINCKVIVGSTPSHDCVDFGMFCPKLKMPPGWKYRVEILPDNLTMVPVNSTARITQDELQNTYDAYDNGFCNIKLYTHL